MIQILIMDDSNPKIDAIKTFLIDSGVLSRLMHEHGKTWPHDRRILAVAKVLGLAPEDCFEREAKLKPNPSLMTGEG